MRLIVFSLLLVLLSAMVFGLCDSGTPETVCYITNNVSKQVGGGLANDSDYVGNSLTIINSVITVTREWDLNVSGNLTLINSKIIMNNRTASLEINALNVSMDRQSVISATEGGYDVRSGLGYHDDGVHGEKAAHGGRCRLDSCLIYDSAFMPFMYGSGGGSEPGGGLVRINVTQDFIFDGAIYADGGNNSGTGSAGAGGSVFITTSNFSGSGVITAHGGNSASFAVKGGGGRISVYYDETNFSVDDMIESSSDTPDRIAQAGTIIFVDVTKNNAVIRSGFSFWENYSTDGTNTYEEVRWDTGAGFSFNNVSFIDASNIRIYNETSISADYVEFISSAVRSDKHSLSMNLNQCEFEDSEIVSEGNITIDSDDLYMFNATWTAQRVNLSTVLFVMDNLSNISTCGKGYPYLGGPGYNVQAAHGGGCHQETCKIYDSVFIPEMMGSSPASKRGGGVVRIDAVVIDMNGTIKADGETAFGSSAAGGAGGSILITTDALNGVGYLFAEGGNSSHTVRGGGGRIAVYYNTTEWSNEHMKLSRADTDENPLQAGSVVFVDMDDDSAFFTSGITFWENYTTGDENFTEVRWDSSEGFDFANITVDDAGNMRLLQDAGMYFDTSVFNKIKFKGAYPLLLNGSFINLTNSVVGAYGETGDMNFNVESLNIMNTSFDKEFVNLTGDEISIVDCDFMFTEKMVIDYRDSFYDEGTNYTQGMNLTVGHQDYGFITWYSIADNVTDLSSNITILNNSITFNGSGALNGSATLVFKGIDVETPVCAELIENVPYACEFDVYESADFEYSMNVTHFTTYLIVNGSSGIMNISVNKTDSDDPVTNGSFVNYTINVLNTGNVTAWAVNITEVYPAGFKFNSSVPAATSSNNSWYVSSLNGLYQINITMEVVGSVPPDTYINNVTVFFQNLSGTRFNISETEETTVLSPNSPNVTISKTATAQAYNATLINYTLFVENIGFGTAYDVIINESYPANVSFVNSTSSANVSNNYWEIGNLASGGNFSLNITMNVSGTIENGTDLVNSAAVVFSNGTHNLTAYDNATTIGLIKMYPELSVTKEDLTDPVNNGSAVTYIFTFSNTGDAIARNITLNESYPINTTYLSSTQAPDASDNYWEIENLSSGETVTLNVTLNTSSTGLINNTAVIWYYNGTDNENLSVYESTTIQAEAYVILQIVKDDLNDEVNNGSLFDYQINISYTGNVEAINVTLTEDYDSVSYVNSSPTVNVSDNVWYLGNLSGDAVVNITVRVNPSVANGTTIFNRVTMTYYNSTGSVSKTANESTLIISSVNDALSVSKNASKSDIDAGEEFNYTIVISNPTNHTFYNVTLNESFDSQVSYVNATLQPSVENVSWDMGNISAGAQSTLQIIVKADSSASGNLINNVSVFYTNGSSDFTVNAVKTVSVTEEEEEEEEGISGGSSRSSGGPSCKMMWSCTEWTKCSVDGTRSRVCIDKNDCEELKTPYMYVFGPLKPAEEEVCEYLPTCADGIMNGDETGIDCGGVCGSCEAEEVCGGYILGGECVECLEDTHCIGICVNNTCMPGVLEEERSYLWTLWVVLLLVGGIIFLGRTKWWKSRKLRSFVMEQKSTGVGESDIKKRLLDVGWDADVVAYCMKKCR